MSPKSGRGEILCRICKEDGTLEELSAPCNCSGSIRWVHSTCLKRWIESRTDFDNYDKCEICNYPFKILIIITVSCKNFREYTY